MQAVGSSRLAPSARAALATVLLAIPCVCLAQGATPDRRPAAQLAAAEFAFAARSVASDMREAFLSVLADDAILLRPGPVPGKAATEKRAAPPIELNWRPAFVQVAASGEVGVSTGPWRIVSRTKSGAPADYGQYCSVWKKNAEGTWQLLLDLGISHPQPTLADAWLELPESNSRAATPEDAQRTMRNFADLAEKSGYAAAVRHFAAADVRVYRNAYAPFLGTAALAALPADDERRAADFVTSGTARSGDMAYALLRLAPRRADGTLDKSAAHALQVWRTNAAGRFELLLDVVNEMPAAK